MKVDEKAKYRDSHEWARKEGDLIVCGITDYAQESLSDVVFVELPELGDSFDQGEAFGVVESVKAASDVYMPMGGEIVEINEALDDAPELVNEEPFEGGWLIKFKPANPDEWEDLLSTEAYQQVVAEEEG